MGALTIKEKPEQGSERRATARNQRSVPIAAGREDNLKKRLSTQIQSIDCKGRCGHLLFQPLKRFCYNSLYSFKNRCRNNTGSFPSELI